MPSRASVGPFDEHDFCQSDEPAAGVDQICGDGTTFTVTLPGIRVKTPSGGLSPKLCDDRVTLPQGCTIYALLVGGFAANRNFDQLNFYNLAKHVMEQGGYVHFAWWNNLLKEYMKRPLHCTSEQCDLATGPRPGTVTCSLLDVFTLLPGVLRKANPEEDDQFQEDARTLLRAIRLHNPDAKIIVAGHSMGGDSVARLGQLARDVGIDLLAPIDPVGNRTYPLGGLGHHTYNWNRWRATRSFDGWKWADCVRDPNLPLFCKDHDPIQWGIQTKCRAVGDLLDRPPLIGTYAPFICPGPAVVGARRRGFRSDVKNLYHRWQKEGFPPFDYVADIVYQYPPALQSPPLLEHRNYQKAIGTDSDGAPTDPDVDPLYTCSSGSRDGEVCSGNEGHGEIVGFRNRGGLCPEPLALQLLGWPERAQAAERKARLIEMKTADDQWAYRPVNPDLDYVSRQMNQIVDRILQGGPTEPEANVLIDHQASPDPVVTGSEIVYTITIINARETIAEQVLITDDLPDSVTFVSCEATGNGTCGGSGNDRTVSFPSIPGGGSETITLVATANCDLREGTEIINVATVRDASLLERSSTIAISTLNPAPVIVDFRATPGSLSPPNHRMVDVTLDYVVVDNCEGAVATIDVASNEPVNGTGDGNTDPDWEVVGLNHVRVRAERGGGGSGRVYSIVIAATDLHGASSNATAEVVVPLGRSGRRP